MNRRQFLQALAMGTLASQCGQLYAAAAAGKSKFLLVFLRGGYDAANLLIPISSSFYYEVRPHIAIPRSGEAGKSAIVLNADWGLHPALTTSVYPLFQRQQLAFVPFAGTEDTSRSHFETQDTMELGQPLERSRNFRSGFMNRLAVELNGRESIAFTDQLPLAFTGSLNVPNVSLKNVGKGSLGAHQADLIREMYKTTPLKATVDEGFEVREQVMHDVSHEMDTANKNAITSKGFELEARRIARMMKERYSLGFVDVGGWDTHVGEGGATGYLAGHFEALGRGLSAFADEMGSNWRDTTVVVMSEFGRTFRENGNNGTDHGHGSVIWVLGGGIRGGQITGEQVVVSSNTLFQGRDFQVLNEYRSVLGALFVRMFGLSPAQIDRVFPTVRPRDWGLI